MLRILLAITAGVTLLLTLFGSELPRRLPNTSQSVQLAPAARAVAPASIPADTDKLLLAADDFSVSVNGAWSRASKGGSYALFGPAEDFSVSGGAGTIRTPAGEDRTAVLTAVQARDVDA